MTLLTYNATCEGSGPATRISGDGIFDGTGLFVGVRCSGLPASTLLALESIAKSACAASRGSSRHLLEESADG